MPVLGVTGGIASGKSTFARGLAGMLDAELFDADRCAREVLEGDAGIIAKVLAAFGDEIACRDFGDRGSAPVQPSRDHWAHDEARPPGGLLIDRAKLREIVFRSPEKRRVLESILHPAIRAAWVAKAEQVRQENCWMIVDIPLLYETDAVRHFDAVIVVGCSRETQMERLMGARELDRDLSGRMIDSQLALAEKVARADHVVWNDGLEEQLLDQARVLADQLRSGQSGFAGA